MNTLAALVCDNIYKGDSLILMEKIPSNSIHMIFSDLPFGTTKNNWDKILDFDVLWKQYERVLTENGVILLFAQSPFDKVLACSNLKLFRYEWIWEKTSATGHLNARIALMKAHENILVFYKKKPTYNPIKTRGERKVSSASSKEKSNNSTNYGRVNKYTDYDSVERFPRSVLKFPTDKQKEHYHPTQKPIELIKYMIKTYTNEGDVVLDNCMGSGTTPVGCIQTNRKYIGIEKDNDYFNIASDRINKAYGNVGLFHKESKEYLRDVVDKWKDI